MRELNFVDNGKLEWREVDEPKLEGDGRGARAAAGGRHLRPRHVAGPRPDPRPRARSRSGTSASPRWSRSATRSPGPAGRSGQRPVPDLLRRVRDLPPGPHRQLRAGRADVDVRAPDRHELRRLPQRLGARPVRRRDARPGARRGRPAAIASLSDNIPDAWRTVGPQLEAEPGRAGADLRRRRIDRPLRGRDRARARRRAGRLRRRAARSTASAPSALGANLARRGVPGAPRAVPDHGRRQRRPRRARVRAALDRARGDLHEHRRSTSSRDDPGAAARDVHEGDPRSTPAASTPGRRWSRSSSWSATGAFNPELVTGETARGTTPPRRSPATARSS